ncbi:DNA-binding protein, partial [Escherichia coli]
SGNGKRPLALQKLLDEGHFMEDFLIEKTKPEQAE